MGGFHAADDGCSRAESRCCTWWTAKRSRGSRSAWTAAAALVFGFRGGAVGALRPESALRSDLVFGLALGLAGGVYVGLPGGLRGGVLSQIPWVRDVPIPVGGLLGILLGVAAGLALGSRMFVRYAVSVAIEASAGRLPIRLARFLAWARDAGLLRESGPAYQFRHERFREWIERDRRG